MISLLFVTIWRLRPAFCMTICDDLPLATCFCVTICVCGVVFARQCRGWVLTTSEWVPLG